MNAICVTQSSLVRWVGVGDAPLSIVSSTLASIYILPLVFLVEMISHLSEMYSHPDQAKMRHVLLLEASADHVGMHENLQT